MTKSKLASVGIAACVVAWIGSGYLVGTASQKNDVVDTNARAGGEDVFFTVGVRAVETVSHSRAITLSGTTRADKKGSAVSRTSGTLSAVLVREGDFVTEGSVVAEILDETLDSALEEALSRLEQRRAEHSSKKALLDNGSFPALSFLQVEAELRAAESAVSRARDAKERALVRAPFSGFVEEVFVEEGETVAAGARLLSVISPYPMLVVAEVPERRLPELRIGAEASVRIATGVETRGTVRFISRNASSATRSYRVDILVTEERADIPAGATSEVIVSLDPIEASRVDRSSIVFSTRGELGVMVVDADDIARFVAVEIVEDLGEEIAVTGIPSASLVIVRGQDFVVSGQRVLHTSVDAPRDVDKEPESAGAARPAP